MTMQLFVIYEPISIFIWLQTFDLEKQTQTIIVPYCSFKCILGRKVEYSAKIEAQRLPVNEKRFNAIIIIFVLSAKLFKIKANQENCLKFL